MKARKWLVLTLIVGLLPLISGCFEIAQIFQGLSVIPGGNVSVTLKVKTDKTDANPHYGIVGVLIPNDWTVNTIKYDGDFGPDECTLLPPGTPDKEPGLQDYWTDTLEVKYPSGDGMKWVVFQANTAYPSAVELGNVNVYVQMTAGTAEGDYDLGYFVSNSALDFTDPTYYSMKKAKIKVSPQEMHLLLSEIVVTMTNDEYIEIFNPTAQDIDLSNYYITDATFASDGTYYYNIVTGTKYGGGGFSDFNARFPEVAKIMPGEYQTVALEGDANFFAKFNILPTYEIADDGAAGPDVPDMRDAMPGSINKLGGGLTNTGEVVILYYWDGLSDLVQDVDYFIYSDKGQPPAESVDKTDVKKDGPDADTETSTYKPDTPIADQKFVFPPKVNEGAQRIDFFEGTEAKANGNGITMHNETSENLDETWVIAAPTPNAAYLVVTAINVTFQCNMDVQIKSGTFDPTKDKLVVRGSFNGWAGNVHELKDPDADNIYTLTTELGIELIGQTVEYKYVMLPSGGADVWEGVDNRKFTLADKDMVLDVVYFNNQTVILVKATVTFQADMSDMLDKGWFDPSTDSIRVVGGMNGWANSESMEPDPFDPSLYLYDAMVTAAVGDKIGWKFRGYPNNRFLDGGWEAGSNHEFEFTGADLLLDPLKPNILPGGKPIAQDVTVRFSVDVNGAVDWYNKKPFEAIKSVWVTGDWNNWGGSWGVADTTVLIKMYDDGLTKGDAVKGDGIYTTEVLFTAGTMSSKLYKFSIYAAGVDTLNKGTSPMDNEAGMGMNHVILIDDTNPLMVLPIDYF
ncbi:lamin tail domain-containing protein, partial [candidate division KSB1 bacterium]|nr:lamin tail domain-containing protein [candidate division KSB1 bacterium]